MCHSGSTGGRYALRKKVEDISGYASGRSLLQGTKTDYDEENRKSQKGNGEEREKIKMSQYQIRHALVQYGADTILEDVNFEVHDNEKIAVVGRNGCGKTTLLKLIAGDIRMNNLDSDEECGITMAGKQEIGFLRQVSFPDGEVTAEEEIKKTFAPVFQCEARMAEIEQALHGGEESQELL